MVHSEKGYSMLKQINNRIKIKEVKLNQASQMNRAMIKSVKHQKVRGDILEAISKSGFQPLQALLPNQTKAKQLLINKIEKIMMKALYTGSK